MTPSTFDLEATRETLQFAEMTGFIKRREGIIKTLEQEKDEIVELWKKFNVKEETAFIRKTQKDMQRKGLNMFQK